MTLLLEVKNHLEWLIEVFCCLSESKYVKKAAVIIINKCVFPNLYKAKQYLV